MKVAITTNPPGGLNATLNLQFGRCPMFTIIEIDASGNIVNTKIIPNPGTQAMHGAGPLAAQTVAQEGVDTIISGNFGPNASNALMSLGIKMYQAPPNITVRDAINMLLSGTLAPASPVGAPGYGMGRGMGRGRGMGMSGGMGRGMGKGRGMGRGGGF